MVPVGYVVNHELLDACADEAYVGETGCAVERALSPVSLSFFPPQLGWAFLRGFDNAAMTRSEAARRRSAEFLEGRRAAYMALCQVGYNDPVMAEPIDASSAQLSPQTTAYLARLVSQQADRSPGWPAGFVGSIAHSRNWIVAVSASASSYASVGVDAEAIVTQEQAELLQPEIGQPCEWSLLQSIGLKLPTAFTLLFSAKEAFYKCWYPLRRTFLNFTDVQACHIEPERRSSRADAQTGLLTMQRHRSDDMRLEVRYQVTPHDVFTITTHDTAGS